MAPVDNGAQTETKDQAITSTTAATDPYNVEAAEILASSAQHMPIAQAAPIYEQILSLFPTASKFWKQYAEAHMAVNNDDAIKQIFSRCLLNCLHVPLWRCYIRFIRKVNEKKGAEGQDEIRKAFDFMLGYVVTDCLCREHMPSAYTGTKAMMVFQNTQATKLLNVHLYVDTH
ncbi:RNA CLEAVAGE STIMULATION FACTOR [Salix koriyanagi]|uniref:RNA CLEAVAGE STIMULATION FACTOR n=1 Tax=Salix koriyanagi TaxID=2511006 RepID=A0A9Q0SZZ9_9ROSI|nr:RNA CLEAVAGE STIMULATION FACTOR [Salix koriyanagi]KAJ6695704.1 RNA CLEAVAGE STIMULATION FACTOR [Salix koriyanagi]